MIEERFTRVARWLATRLSVSDGNNAVTGNVGDFASRLIREGGELGFSEAVVRASLGEIGANVERYGTRSEFWSFDAAWRQVWMNWAAANGVPSPLTATREAIAEFWTQKAAAAAVAVPAASVATTATSSKKPVYDPPLSPTMEAFYRKQRSGSSLEYGRRAAELVAEENARKAEDATKPQIDAASIYARRKGT